MSHAIHRTGTSTTLKKFWIDVFGFLVFDDRLLDILDFFGHVDLGLIPGDIIKLVGRTPVASLEYENRGGQRGPHQ